MRGDGAPRDAAGGETPRTRKGPRHAAPRKSLLTKLQIPAGKAMALAAMPTAVFVGMGLTPRLALAEDSKDIPFAPGPCVTRSDGPDASASPSPSASGSSKPDGSPSGSPAPSGSGQDERPDGERSPSGDGGTGDTGDAADTGASRPGTAPSPSPSGSPAPTPTPTPAPTPTKTRNPLDPLGLGDALGGLFGGDGKKETAGPEPGATADRPTDTDPGTSSGEAADKDKDKDKAGAEDADKAADNGTDEGADKGSGKKKDGSDTASDDTASDGRASDDADDAADETRKSIEEAARKAGASVEELDDAAKGLEARKDDDIPSAASGKEPFPCPTPDPDALAAAEEEPGIPLLPDDPWTLHSTLLTLRGLDYKGIVEVRTAAGEVKKALKFTSTSIDIKDLHQTVVYPEGKTGNVKAAEGSTSTFRDGEVTMYTEKLTGNLFGIVPITFSPETPPPLNVPYAFFTDVEVIQAGQFGGTLTVPGLRNYLTD
ncbi:hypothetical protein [Streptomyces sp. NRRL F-5135]|uniref:hypothetical protein n=1 Tax=Streptomyces sp. NRRL F-5135 TaxID=1463858 RepID=UPI0004C6BE34|nr:hypothetical protein [Streptomyces sp. NRRL F-5135]